MRSVYQLRGRKGEGEADSREPWQVSCCGGAAKRCIEEEGTPDSEAVKVLIDDPEETKCHHGEWGGVVPKGVSPKGVVRKNLCRAHVIWLWRMSFGCGVEK